MYILLTILYLTLKMKISRKKLIFAEIIFILIIAYIFFCFNFRSDITDLTNFMKEPFDLARYYVEINAYRKMKWNNILLEIKQQNEPLRVLLFYIISKTDNNKYIQFITGFLVYFQLWHNIKIILKEENKTIRYYLRDLFFIFIVIDAFLPATEILVGIRNAIAYTVVITSYINYFYKKTKLNFIKFIIYSFLAMLLHNSAILVIIIILIFNFFPSLYKFRFILLFWQIILKIICTFFLTNNNFVSIFLINTKVYRNYLYWIVYFIVLINLYLIVSKIIKYLNKKEKVIFKLINIFIIVIIGGTFNLIGLRFLFLIGIFMPVLILKMKKLKRTYWYYINFILFLVGIYILNTYNILYFLLMLKRSGGYFEL